MITVEDLNYRTKKIRGKEPFAIQDISFHLEEGYMMCLLGRNGAGKTTLLELLNGMIVPDSGRIELPLEETAFVGGSAWCVESWTVQENVLQFSRLTPSFDEKLFEDTLQTFGMETGILSRKFKDLSTGQKMQVQSAFAFAKHPRVLLLDEPVANMDPVVRTDYMELLHQKVTREKTTVIVSTHLVEDITDLVDYIGIMEHGKLTDYGNRDQIMQRYDSQDLRQMLLHKGTSYHGLQKESR